MKFMSFQLKNAIGTITGAQFLEHQDKFRELARLMGVPVCKKCGFSHPDGTPHTERIPPDPLFDGQTGIRISPDSPDKLG